MTIGIKSLFGGVDQILDEVIILPLRGGTGNNGQYRDGTYSLPAGYTWEDFEYLETNSGSSTNDNFFGTQKIDKEIMRSEPTTWSASVGYNDAGANYFTQVKAVSATTFTLDNANDGVDTVNLTLMKGYIRRYASRNLSKIVNVNSGVNISAGQRYEIDIASSLGHDYLDRDLIVKAEIYNSDATGTVGWGDPNWIQRNDTPDYRGVRAAVLNNKIVVQTGNGALVSGNASYQGHPFGNLAGNITSAPCRVKVWKVDEYIRNIASNPLDNIFPVGSVVLRMDTVNPSTIYGGAWSLITGDASLTFGDGTDQDGIASGENTPAVPVPRHRHTINHDHGAVNTSSDTHTHSLRSGKLDSIDHYNRLNRNRGIPGINNGDSSGSWTNSGSLIKSDAHSHSVNLPNFSGNSGYSGTDGATLDVRGARIAINVWQRTA